MENPLAKLNQKLPAAASRLGQLPKVTPEMMMIVYLDEIAGRLAELQDTFSEITAEGELMSFTYPITDTPTKLVVHASYLTLHNDGPNSVYLLSFKGNPLTESPITNGSSLNVDFRTRRVRTFSLVCGSGGTASVRCFWW